MYSPIQIGFRYLVYQLRASNGKGHGIHSPFVFEFITKLLNDDREFYAYTAIEQIRELLLIDKTEIMVEDLGAGSRVIKQASRMVADIAASSLKPKKYGQLLFRMADHYGSKKILELGTSLGITTAYLASANESSSVITLEGAKSVAALAQTNFHKLALPNIALVEGNFDETLSEVLKKEKSFDLIFVDGNHRLEPTLRYFRQLLPAIHEYSILIFDDIHWSKEMEQAWEQIKEDSAVTLSIDLFFIGIVFFRKENKAKQHFTIRF